MGVYWSDTRERLPAIVTDGDNSLPDALLGTGRTKSKSALSIAVNGTHGCLGGAAFSRH